MEKKKEYIPPMIEETKVVLEGNITMSLINQPSVTLEAWEEDQSGNNEADIWVNLS